MPKCNTYSGAEVSSTEIERAKCRTQFLSPPSCLFALLPSSPFPFRLGRPLRLSPFLQFPASARPGQKTRPRAARCFLKGGRPRPRPISGSNAGGRGISSPGGRRRRRGSGEMRWLSQKLTAKIDRPADAAAAVLRPPSSVLPFLRPLRRRQQQRRKKSKKRRCRCSARSLTRFVRSSVLSPSPPPLEKIAVAAFFYGSGRG